MTPDTINGLFEFGGVFAIALSVRNLHSAKIVRGVSWPHVAFFTSWGFWNLFYYPSLEQWFSFSCGLALVAVNAVWLGQILYYRRKERLLQSHADFLKAFMGPIETPHFDPATRSK